MQLFNSTSLPNSVIAWITPILSKFTFLSDKPISAVGYYVAPVGGDVSFVIFQQDDKTYVLVTADYPDPRHDSGQLQQLSQRYSFTNVITPAGEVVNREDIEIDKFLKDFFVRLDWTYYYCGSIEQK